MSLGDAFGDASEILTIVALIPVCITLIIMGMNMTNPDFDMIAWFESAMFGLVNAMIPALGAIVVLGLVIYFLRIAGEMSL